VERLDQDGSVPDWLIEYPSLLPLFKRLGIDYCCGGKSLATACRERGLEVTDVMRRSEPALAIQDAHREDAYERHCRYVTSAGCEGRFPPPQQAQPQPARIPAVPASPSLRSQRPFQNSPSNRPSPPH
jgi:hypothetical protein